MLSKPKSEFPLTVRAGSTALKIYRERKRSGDYFRLAFYLGGKRHRLNFSSLDAAKTEAAAKAAQFARGDVDAVQLTGRDRLTYGRALDALKSTGVALTRRQPNMRRRWTLQAVHPRCGQFLHAPWRQRSFRAYGIGRGY